MRLLDRYLLRELLIPLGYCVGGFLIFWIAFDLFSELDALQQHKLGALDLVGYYAVRIPEFVVLVLPVALLLALLYALTQHTRHHEIAAIRAAGVSLWRLSLPYFAVGLVSGGLLFVLNELCVPDSAERAERILRRHDPRSADGATRDWVRNLDFTNAREARTWHIGAYNLRTGEMLEPHVDYRLPEGGRRWLFAARAHRTNDTWVFLDVREYTEDARRNPLLLPARQTNLLAMPAFSETPEVIRSEINISRRLSLRSARRADIPLVEIADYLRLHPQLTPADRAWLHTKLHGRLAAPGTCLVVVLIALPFGAAPGRRSVFVGVAGSVFLCFAYFILLQLGLALGSGGYLPAWLAAWSPNLSFGLAGLWLTARLR